MFSTAKVIIHFSSLNFTDARNNLANNTHRKIYISLQESLEYFGERRTDLEVGSTFQGVETASQIRYVEYFEKIKKNFNGKMPPAKELKLKRVTVTSIKGDYSTENCGYFNLIAYYYISQESGVAMDPILPCK